MRFNRLENLVSKNGIELLKNKTMMVFGLGGVGSFAAEALVRSGIGQLIVVDYDSVDITNINRQLIALDSTIGHKKTDVFLKRAKDINPNINITSITEKVSQENVNSMLEIRPDFVLDCIDDVFAKVELAKACYHMNIPIMLAMGFANKFHPEMIKISTLKKTSVCPLAKVMRRKIRDIGLPLDIPVVYSEEKPASVIDNQILGSTAFCPSTAGLMMASYAINYMIERENEK
ncbi:tRNA threonylcarbamoyladenosine dehydratase [Mycoplasmatota bacterium]|nr:tRNA threonylcarbamoyladenosine dehydratase [Mycoplasmatota bacterium]